MTKENETLEALKRMSEEDPDGFSSDVLALIDYKLKTAKVEAYKEVFEKLNEKAVVRKTKIFGGLHSLKVVTLHDINALKNELVGDA